MGSELIGLAIQSLNNLILARLTTTHLLSDDEWLYRDSLIKFVTAALAVQEEGYKRVLKEMMLDPDVIKDSKPPNEEV